MVQTKLTEETVVKIFESLTTSAEVLIRIDAKPNQKFFKTKAGGKKKRTLAVFKNDDSVSGIVEIRLKEGEELEHFGIKIMLIGFLEIYSDDSLSTEFHSLSKELMPAGTLKVQKTTLKFKFNNFDKDYESFYGICGEIRYFLRASIVMDKYIPNINHEVPFAVFKPESKEKYQETNPILMDVGSQGKVNIQLEIYKNSFHLKDCIEGTVTFTEVKVSIRSMELLIVRKEKLGSEKLIENDTQIMISYELMDGSPEAGQKIPIRMYLNGVEGLNPSFVSLHNRLTVIFSLKLMIVDVSGKKYFKETPITLYREFKEEK